MRKFAFGITFLTVGTIIFVLINKDRINSFYNELVWYSKCDVTIEYKLTNVDAKFEVSREEVLKGLEDSAKAWNTALEREVFVYSPDGVLAVELIYDERQRIYSQVYNYSTQLDKTEANYKDLYNQYEEHRTNLEKKYAQLNEQIDYWNELGGAPKYVYQSLVEKTNELKKQGEVLEQERLKLNKFVDEMNMEVAKYNNLIEDFSTILKLKPEAGYYNGQNKISIFFYDDTDQFKHTAAHEFGHALGIDHVEDESSIMYPVSSETFKFTQSDLQAIEDFCKPVNRMEEVRNAITMRLDNISVIYENIFK